MPRSMPIALAGRRIPQRFVGLALVLLMLCAGVAAQPPEESLPALRLSDSLMGMALERGAPAANTLLPTASRSGWGLSAQRTKLAEQLVRTLEEHQLIEAFTADRDGAAAQQGAERSGLFPRVTTRSASGTQDYSSPSNTAGKQLNTTERTIGVNQVLWDFGATIFGVNRAGKQLSIAEMELESQRQNLLYAAIEAVLNLARSAETLSLGKVNEQQLESIAELENEKILAGRGFATDLEQAASQLELARSRNNMLLSNYQSARYRFETIFLEPPSEDFALSVIPDVAHLPATMAAMVSQIETGNYDYRSAQLRTEVRRDERSQVIARDYLPRIDLQLEKSQQSNFYAAPGVITSEKASVVASWNFDVGLKAGYALDSLSSGIRAEAARAAVTRKQVVEDARSTWSAWEAANQRVIHLENQRRHAERFVEFVKIEREYGRRTLLEVLNGELLLLNVKTDLVAAMVDRKLYAYRILKGMGQLNFNSLRLADF